MHFIIALLACAVAITASPVGLPPPDSLLSRQCWFSECPVSDAVGRELSSVMIVRDALMCRYKSSNAICTYSLVRNPL
jgi:hypothetical protein